MTKNYEGQNTCKQLALVRENNLVLNSIVLTFDFFPKFVMEYTYFTLICKTSLVEYSMKSYPIGINAQGTHYCMHRYVFKFQGPLG